MLKQLVHSRSVISLAAAWLLLPLGARYEKICPAQELAISPIRLAGEPGVDLPPLLGGPPSPSVFWNFGIPSITSNGHILYTAQFSTNPANDVLFDTRDSIWTTNVADPTLQQLQVRWGSPAPLGDWNGNMGVFDAPDPLFNGAGQDRLRAWGITNAGTVLFSAGRFGIQQTPGRTPFFQDDDHIIWQASGGVIDEFANFGELATVDFEYLSDAGQAAMVVDLGGPDLLFVNDLQVAQQDGVPSAFNIEFVPGFGRQGGYQFTHQGDLLFQSSLTATGLDGIYRANPNTIESIVVEGDSYTLPNGSMATLSDLRSPTFNGYGLQVTSAGEAGFIGDGSVLLAGRDAEPTARAVVTPGFFPAIIDGATRNIQMFEIDDLFIGPDDTIYFEARAEIRELGFLGEFINYIWKMERDPTTGDYTIPQTLLAEGEVAIELQGPNDILFGDQFVLKDANGDGNLLLTVELDDSHADVNNSNDDTLVMLDVDGFPTLLARQGAPIPLQGGFTYGVPEAARGASLSDNGDVVFRSGAFFSNDPSDTRLPAVLLATTTAEEVLDFVWSGACQDDPLNWHALCSLSNWNDSNMEPAFEWPGDESGTQNAFIGGSDVVISDQAVDLRSLRATGSLQVNQALRLRENSIAENLDLNADLTVDQKLDLSGNDNRWRGGTITGDAANVTAGTSKLEVDSNARLLISGAQHTLRTNLDVKGMVDQIEGLLTIDQPATLTIGSAAVYSILSGGITTTQPITNEGALQKRKPNAAQGEMAGDVTVEGRFNLESGTIAVDFGTLTIHGDGDHTGSVLYAVDAGSTLRFLDGLTNVTDSAVVAANGVGTVELQGGIYAVDAGASATFNMTSASGLILDDVLIRADGLVKNMGHATVKKATINGRQIVGEGVMDGFENRGRITHQSMAELSLTGSRFINKEGGDYSLSGTLNATGGTFVNEGNLFADGGTLTGGTVTADGSMHGLHNNGGLTSINNNTWTIAGVFHNSGRRSGASLSIGNVLQNANVALRQGSIINSTDGVYTMTAGNLENSAAPSTFHNRGGTLKKTEDYGAVIDVDFNMTGGLVDVEQGTLTFTGQGTHTGTGTYRIAEGAFLVFDASPITFSGNYRLEGRGRVIAFQDFLSEALLVTNLTGPGAFVFSGAQAGGFRVAGATLMNTGNAEWNKGDLGRFENTGGMLEIKGSMQKNLRGSLSNTGVVNHRAEATVTFTEATSSIVNSGEYILDGMLTANGEFQGSITNIGTFRLNNANVSRTFAGSFDNQGIVEVAQGSTLHLAGDVEQLTTVDSKEILSGGLWIANAGAAIRLGDGTQRISINRGHVILKGSGKLSVLPDASNSSSTHDFENSGVFELREGAIFNTAGFLENNRSLFVDSSSTLNVGGQFETNHLSDTHIDGVLTTEDLDFDGGEFRGEGTINGRRFFGNGNLKPGRSPGTLTLNVDEFLQGSSGRIVVEIAGMTAGQEYDQLVISGTAELAGTLELQFIAGAGGGIFIPDDGTQFEFVTAAGGITGQFDQIVTPSTGLGAEVSVAYASGSVMLTVLDTFLIGDYNASGAVEQADLDLVLLNWGEELSDPLAAGWTDDLPDGPIDQAELDRVLLNWGNSLSAMTAATPVVVPEPTSFLLFAAAFLLAVLRSKWGKSNYFLSLDPFSICFSNSARNTGDPSNRVRRSKCVR